MEEEILSAAESAPQEEAGDSEFQGASGGDTAPESGREAAITPSAEEEAEAGKAVLPIRYKHQTKELTMEQARLYAQKGMKFDELSPMLEKLKRMAAAEGQSLTSWADALEESRNQERYRSLLRECYGDRELAKRLFQVQRDQGQARYEADARAEADTERQAGEELHRRLAAEFLELKGEFPEVPDFAALPKAVVETAVRRGISLTDAYLRHRHAEEKRIAAAKTAGERAARAAVGSQAAGAGETEDPAIDAMLAGVWRQ